MAFLVMLTPFLLGASLLLKSGLHPGDLRDTPRVCHGRPTDELRFWIPGNDPTCRVDSRESTESDLLASSFEFSFVVTHSLSFWTFNSSSRQFERYLTHVVVSSDRPYPSDARQRSQKVIHIDIYTHRHRLYI